jgi:hypothetical protein
MATEKRPDVPEDVLEVLVAVVNGNHARWYISGGTGRIEFTELVFCQWYAAERQRIRQQVADEIADHPGPCLRDAAEIARGEPSHGE